MPQPVPTPEPTPAPTPAPTALGDKTFDAQDQRDFAAASGDYNPIHVDPVAARRLLSGRQIVHGVHTLLQALERWRPADAGGARRFVCSFANPINVGDPVRFSQVDGSDGRCTISASVDGLVCTELVIEPAPALAAAPPPAAAVRRLGVLAAPLDEDENAWAGTRVQLAPGSDAAARAFPQATQRLGPAAVTAIAQLSTFVGMVCPGLHSVFSSLQFTLGTDGAADALVFEVRKYDARFRLYTVAFDGPVRGELRAFRRPPPQPQPRAQELAARVRDGEFAGQRVLVVGGSRGLGETTAKLLAAGGAYVFVSYAAGADDARAVAADIAAAGRGRCEPVPLDLRADFTGVAGLDPARLDAVYYFATPRIYGKRSELFHRPAFDEFVEFYLQRFYQLCRWLDGAGRTPPPKVYLPSTVFIDERPRGMTEYAMAKAAAEVLAEDINRALRHVRVVHSRLPRMATDQTASIRQEAMDSTVDTLLGVLRSMAG